MVTSKDYTFLEIADSENWAVRILSQKYLDVIFEYGKIGLVENDSKTEARLQFNYKIFSPGEFEEDELVKSPEFNNYVGDILTSILDDALAENNFKLGKNDRTNSVSNSQESDSE